jgi:hypothetical protein
VGFRRHVLLALALAVSACGGGGGSDTDAGTGGTSISVTPRTLTFTSELGEPLPPVQDIQVTYQGAGLLVGFPPEETEVGWIEVFDNGGTVGSHSLGIRPSSAPAAIGQRDTTFRIVTSRDDGTLVKFADVEVVQQVIASTFTAGANPDALTFLAASGGALPATKSAVLVLSDGTVTGAADDVAWLSVTVTGTTVTASITSTANAASTRAGTITVEVQRPSGSLKYVQIPVSYTLVPGLAVDPAVLPFSAFAGSSVAPLPSTRSFAITGSSNLDWTASSNQPWLVLAQTSGTGPGTVNFTLDHSGLAAGTHPARIDVYDAFSDRTKSVDVTLVVSHPEIVSQPSSAVFTVDAASSASSLTKAVMIGDNGDAGIAASISWTIASINKPWLTASPAAGASKPATELTLALDAAEVAELEDGLHWAEVSIAYTDAGGVERTTIVGITLLLELPRARTIAPYTAIAGRADRAIVRGAGFTGLQASQVSLGGTAPTSFEVISDTEFRVGYPGLAAGNYAVAVDNVLEVDVSDAELVALAPQDRPSAVFTYELRSEPNRLVFDDQRGTLYVVAGPMTNLERFQVVDGAWTRLPDLGFTRVNDVALSPDGKALYILAMRELYSLDLDDPLAAPVLHHTRPETFYEDYYYKIGVTNDGYAHMTLRSQCCTGNLEPVVKWALGEPFVYSYGPISQVAFASRVVPSGDGRLAVIGSAYHYRYVDGVAGLGPVSGKLIDAVNTDASQLSELGEINGLDYTPLGRVSLDDAYVAFGRRSDRAYAFRAHNQALDLGDEVLVFDPTAPLETGFYPEIARIALPEAANMEDGMSAAGALPVTVSADGRTFFLRTWDKLIIVPVPAE